MPQIWMTYDEIASLFACEPASARDIAIRMELDRRKSRNGQTRVKLDTSLTALFLDKLLSHWIDRELQACAGDLRAMRDRMAAREDSTTAESRHAEATG
jgi:hypothetical protein